MSRLRTNVITNRMANGAPTVSNGLVISGVTTTSEIFVGNNIKLDPVSGIVTASTYYGDGSNLSNITSTTINNNANNRIITGSGSANTLEGESSFTYDGNGGLDMEGTSAAFIQIKTPNNTDGGVYFRTGSSNPGAVSYLHTDNSLRFRVNSTEKMIIDKNGNTNVTGILTATSFSGDGSALTGVSSPTANRNFITNGSMQFWQRGTTFNSQGNGQNDYTADRWAIGHNNSHMAAVTQQDGAGAGAKFAYCARVQRDSGQSQTDQMRFHTALETKEVQLLRGEVLTISYYARKGANYSEANSKITGVRIATGENIDGDPNAYSGGHWTNAETILTGTPTLTTNWQRFSHTTNAVSNYANSMIIEFRHTPTGTAGANDYYEVTGVQLEIGSSMTAFEHRRYSDELRRCQRYCFRFGGGDTEQYTTLLMGIQSHSQLCKAHVQFPVDMRSKDVTFSFSNLTLDDDIASYSAGRIFSVNSENAGKNSATLIFNTASMSNVNATRILTDASGGYIQCECEL